MCIFYTTLFITDGGYLPVQSTPFLSQVILPILSNRSKANLSVVLPLKSSPPSVNWRIVLHMDSFSFPSNTTTSQSPDGIADRKSALKTQDATEVVPSVKEQERSDKKKKVSVSIMEEFDSIDDFDFDDEDVNDDYSPASPLEQPVIANFKAAGFGQFSKLKDSIEVRKGKSHIWTCFSNFI